MPSVVPVELLFSKTTSLVFAWIVVAAIESLYIAPPSLAELFLNEESVMVKPLTSDEAYIAPPFEEFPVALFDVKSVFSMVNLIFAESVIPDFSAYIAPPLLTVSLSSKVEFFIVEFILFTGI